MAERRFRTYWAGQTVSEVGDRVSELALPLTAVLVLDASPFAVGALTAAVWAPHLVSLFVGAWVDARPRKRPLLVAANLVQALAVLSVPVAAAVGALSMPVLYAAALVGGRRRARPHGVPAVLRPPRLPRPVRRRELAALHHTLGLVPRRPAGGRRPRQARRRAGRARGRLLLVPGGGADDQPRRRRRGAAGTRDSGALPHAGSASGCATCAAIPYLRVTLACSTTLNLASLAVQAILVLYAARVLDLGPGALGLALGVGAVGASLGALVAGPVATALGTGPHDRRSEPLSFTAPFALLPLAEGAPPSCGWPLWPLQSFCLGLAIMLYDINNNSLQAAVTDDRMRSRVSGAYSTSTTASVPSPPCSAGSWPSTWASPPRWSWPASPVRSPSSGWSARPSSPPGGSPTSSHAWRSVPRVRMRTLGNALRRHAACGNPPALERVFE